MMNFDWAKRSHKGLRKWIMYIVRDSSKSGVEIMDIMEANLQGWWRPSPGSIYPMLKNMVKEGVLSRSDEDKYALTDAGKDEIERPWAWADRAGPAPRTVEGALEVISSYASYLEDLHRSKDEGLSEHAGEIKELAERLSKVGQSA
ncbi:MAG: PadR family transcriptional regulator [Nitrososphaerota archaeon]|nr:PadR family transcriptional regulator [Nitrososphaerota archaeon]MDG7011036.1 PadR family transcriptional regulator [Nitrososphaerota archaeon]